MHWPPFSQIHDWGCGISGSWAARTHLVIVKAHQWIRETEISFYGQFGNTATSQLKTVTVRVCMNAFTITSKAQMFNIHHVTYEHNIKVHFFRRRCKHNVHDL